MLFLTGLNQHLFRLVVHSLSFSRYVFGTTTAVLLDNISKDWTPRGFRISSTAAMDHSEFPVSIALRTLLFRRIVEKYKDLCVVDVGDEILRFVAELVDLLRLAPVLRRKIPCAGGSRTSRSTSWTCFQDVYLAVRLLKVVCQDSCSQRRCYKCLRNSSNRSMVPKMILILGFLILWTMLWVRFLTRLAALSELSEPSGRAHPEFSYIPLSQCKLL